MLKILWRLETLLVSAYQAEAVGSGGVTMHLAAQSVRNSPTASEERANLFFFFSNSSRLFPPGEQPLELSSLFDWVAKCLFHLFVLTA